VRRLCDRSHRPLPRAPPDCTLRAGIRADNKEFPMKTNIGGIDRVLRILAGLALLALMFTGTIGVWGWIGVVPLVTGLFGFCPLYTVLGFNSCPLKKV
jgi:hypothetical protein